MLRAGSSVLRRRDIGSSGIELRGGPRADAESLVESPRHPNRRTRRGKVSDSKLLAALTAICRAVAARLLRLFLAQRLQCSAVQCSECFAVSDAAATRCSCRRSRSKQCDAKR